MVEGLAEVHEEQLFPGMFWNICVPDTWIIATLRTSSIPLSLWHESDAVFQAGRNKITQCSEVVFRARLSLTLGPAAIFGPN